MNAVRDVIDRRPGLVLALLNLLLGLALLLGSPPRTSAPSFAGPRAFLTITQWGVLFLLAAVVCAAAASWGRFGAIGVGAGAGVHAFWATALWYSTQVDERAPLTGMIVYGWVAFLHVLTGVRLARQVG